MYNGIALQSQAGARVWLAALVLSSLSAAPAWAQARKAAGESQAPVGFSLAGAKALFKRVDKDADGALSPSESPASGLGPRDVTAADADKNGRLSESEFLVGFHGWLSASGRTIEADLEAEVAKLRAAVKPAAPATPATPANTAPAAKPVAPRAAAPAPNPADEINRKIDEALRKAQEQDAGAAGGAARPRGVETEPAAQGDLSGLSKEAQDALNRRLRTSGVTPETAAAERQALQQRIDNAGAATAPAEPSAPSAPRAAGAAAPAKPASAPTGGPTAGATGNAPTGAAGAAAAAPSANAGQPAARAAGAPNAPTTAPVDPEAAAKLQRALDATERRMKKDGASAQEIEAAQEQLRQRAQALSNGAGTAANPAATPAAAPATPPAAPASESKPAAAPVDPEMAAKLQRALDATERRMKKDGASAEEIEAAKEQLRQRAQQGGPAATPAVAPATAPTAAPAAAPKPAAAPADPAPAADEDEGPEQDPAVLRNRLEVLLKARNASPEEAAAERAKLEKRIARQASGAKGPKAKARAEGNAASPTGAPPSGAGAQPKPPAPGATQPQRPAANPARGGAGNGRAAPPAAGAPGARPAAAPAAPASGRGADGAKPQPAKPQRP
ncbi:MAG: hypothetical protein JNN27_16450 [Planctomycetes bacterium]|nr:hypothetical protein [Planctomycetota bacterium]